MYNLRFVFCVTIGLKSLHQVWSADIDKQWVDEVLLSSPQFDNDKIVGEPDVYPEYSHVDSHNWIPANIFPYIQLEFKHRRFIKHLDIYETFNAGCVIKIMGRDPDGSWQTLWNATSVEVIERSRIFSPTLNFLDFPIKVISIQTNCSMLENCEEIDAVQMTGCKHRRAKPLEKTPSTTSPLIDNTSQISHSTSMTDASFVAHSLQWNLSSTSITPIKNESLVSSTNQKGTVPVSAIIVPIVVMVAVLCVLGYILWRKGYLPIGKCQQECKSEDNLQSDEEPTDRNIYSNDYTPIERDLQTVTNYTSIDVHSIRPEYTNDYMPMDFHTAAASNIPRSEVTYDYANDHLSNVQIVGENNNTANSTTMQTGENVNFLSDVL